MRDPNQVKTVHVPTVALAMPLSPTQPIARCAEVLRVVSVPSAMANTCARTSPYVADLISQRGFAPVHLCRWGRQLPAALKSKSNVP